MADELLNIELQFGIVIKHHRSAQRLSQEALAESSYLHRTYISQLERGKKSPTLRVIAQLAKALNIRPEVLVRQSFEVLE